MNKNYSINVDFRNIDLIKNIKGDSEEDLKLLEKFSFSDDYEILFSVINHPNCPAYILERLSTHENKRVRILVARNINCTTSTFEKLSDDHKDVIDCLSTNINCPTHVFEKLSIYNSYNVICNLAENINCPAHILKKIYKKYEGYDQYIISLILKNPSWKFKDFE